MRNRISIAMLLAATLGVGGVDGSGKEPDPRRAAGNVSSAAPAPPGLEASAPKVGDAAPAPPGLEAASAPKVGDAAPAPKPGDAAPAPKVGDAAPGPKPGDAAEEKAPAPKTASPDGAGKSPALPQGKAAAAPSGQAGASSAGLQAPLPKPAIKTHFNKGANKYVFKDRAWDLAQIKKAFNTVIVSYDDPQLISDIRAAGLAAIVEFDAKDDPTGKKAHAAVAAIVRQVKLNPGTIAGIRVADRLNEKLTTERAIEYLRLTGGAFHREIPGVPVIVDVEDWELTCGLPGQGSCLTHKFTAYSNCIDATLIELYKTGLVDGYELSVNLKKDDPAAMEKAMTKARAMFPPPFLLYSRTASLSFDEDVYPGDAASARRQVAAFIEIPLKAGADGIDLWAWHRPWKTELRTFLNKGGVSNPLWDEMVRAYGQVVGQKP